jgi:hypothetical protein
LAALNIAPGDEEAEGVEATELDDEEGGVVAAEDGVAVLLDELPHAAMTTAAALAKATALTIVRIRPGQRWTS